MDTLHPGRVANLRTLHERMLTAREALHALSRHDAVWSTDPGALAQARADVAYVEAYLSSFLQDLERS